MTCLLLDMFIFLVQIVKAGSRENNAHVQDIKLDTWHGRKDQNYLFVCSFMLTSDFFLLLLMECHLSRARDLHLIICHFVQIMKKKIV